MAKQRQARRCSARRTDGKPCGAYAMRGADVCHAHGGAAPQVRQAAQNRVTEADVTLAAVAAYARYVREYRKWQINRIAVASVLLGVPVSDLIGPKGVNEALIGWCRIQHGRPAGRESAPKMRFDRRFRAVRALQAGADVELDASVSGPYAESAQVTDQRADIETAGREHE